MLLGSMLAACGSEGEGAADDAAAVSPEASSGSICFREEDGDLTQTSLDFADARAAELVQLVQGHHEAPLFWEPLYLTEGVSGFEQGTMLAADVTVLDFIETDFVPAPSSACEPRLTYHITSEVRLATADGAFAGSLSMPLSFTTDVYGLPVATGTGSVPFDDFVGTFDLSPDPLFSIDPNVELRRTIGVSFGIGVDRLPVSIYPSVSWPLPDGEWHPGWSPGWATTWPRGCLDAEVPLDGTSDREAEILRAWGDVVRAWPSEPIAAYWGNPGQGVPTEVTLGLGSPLRACLDGSDVLVVAPLSVSTADGSLQASYELLTTHHADGGSQSSAGAVYIPVPDFERVAGVRGVDFGGATHGRVDLFVQAAAGGERFAGGLDVSATDADAGVATGFPPLNWCIGEDC